MMAGGLITKWGQVAVEVVIAVPLAPRDVGLWAVAARGNPAFGRQAGPDGMALLGAEGGEEGLPISLPVTGLWAGRS